MNRNRIKIEQKSDGGYSIRINGLEFSGIINHIELSLDARDRRPIVDLTFHPELIKFEADNAIIKFIKANEKS